MLSSLEARIKEKIEKQGIPLKDWNIKIYRGVLTGFNEAFIIDGATKDKLIESSPKNAEIIRPILRGRDIKKYYPEFSGLWIIFTRRGIDIQKYPSVEEYLMQYYNDLKPREEGENRGRKPGNYKWYEIQDAVDYYLDFEKPKIVYPNMTKYMPFVYDKGSFFINDKCFMITGDKLAYLNAFLNSKLFKFAFRDNFPELQGGTRELRKIFVDCIPVKQISDEIETWFMEKNDKIISLIQHNANHENIENEINNKIFEIYALSIGEIEIILSSNKVQSIE